MKKLLSVILVTVICLSMIIPVHGYYAGDVNNDNIITAADARTILRHSAELELITGDMLERADVDGSGDITATDARLALRMGADLEEWKEIAATHTHKYSSQVTKKANCVETGILEFTCDLCGSKYTEVIETTGHQNITEVRNCSGTEVLAWSCNDCKKYFSDSTGATEIETPDFSTGHTPVIDEAVAPTYSSTGLTQGSHCSKCQMIIIAQQTIPVLSGNEYSITYYVTGNDNYLASLNIENPNQDMYSSYTPDDDTIILRNLKSPAGYRFLGWFNGEGQNAVQVTEIPQGSKRDWELFAHWEKIVYTVDFASDMVPVASIKYTTDKAAALPTPKLDKYTFVGWSDSAGNVWNQIPVGTSGDLTLYANWSSNRNKATAVKSLQEPIILEDSENGMLLFTYEIGTIENVPLFTTLKLNCVNGIITEHSKTEENSISSTQAKTVAQTISNATTNSASWTLEKNWNESTEISQSYLDQTGQTQEQVESIAISKQNTFNLTGSLGGSSGTTDTTSGSFKLSGNKSHSDTTTNTNSTKVGLSVDGKISSEKNAGVDAKVVDAGKKTGWQIGAGFDYEKTKTTTTSGTDAWSVGAEIAGEKIHTTSNEKTWNTTAGFSNSSSVSANSTVSNSVSKLISEQYGYGQSYAQGGSNSEAQELATTDTKSDEYSSTITYYTSEIVSNTTTFSSTGNTIGDYRLVMAGKVHVFAVVGYDVANKSYFVYTYNVLDDATEEYLDYSYDGTFNDYETSIIPFEIPVFVNDYVNSRINMTKGLRIDPDTGIIDKYFPTEAGEDTIIQVPAYISVDNGDGTYQSVKVTGISSDLFKNNKNLKGVILGHYITEIPDNAFEGCSSLEYVISYGVTKIGNNAFDGCTSLKKFTVSESITQLGDSAFDGAPEIQVIAYDENVAKAAASSGADNVVLDISMIPEEKTADMKLVAGECESFELQGKDKEYKNLSIKSDAEKTVINGVKFVDCTSLPIDLSSKNITLNRVTANSDGITMLLTGRDIEIKLNGTVSLSSANGNTVVCRSAVLEPLTATVVGKMKVAGNVLVCGDITGKEYLTADGITYISEEDFEKYAKGMIDVIFDANGGTVSQASKSMYFGAEIGTLPVPERENCTFAGWYTSAGEKVEENTVFDSVGNVTLKAYWITDWTLDTEMPENAQLYSNKWTYTLLTKLTSANKTEEGYTLVNSTSAWGDYGAWSAWSKTAASSSDTRQVETKTVTDKEGYTNYKYWIYRTADGYGYGTKNYNTGSHGACTRYDEINLTYALSVTHSGYGLYGYYNSSMFSHGYDNQWFSGGSTWVPAVTHTEYRYRDRQLVYTYYHEKTETKESQTQVFESDTISNIQMWNQYIIK